MKAPSSSLLSNAVNDCVSHYLQEGEVVTVTVNGSCMTPSLVDGQLISVQRKVDYFPGDIVAYYCPYLKTNVVHRLLGAVPFSKRKRYFLQADKSSRPDVLVNSEQILGGALDVPVSLWTRVVCLVKNAYWICVTVSRKFWTGLRG